MLRLDTQDIFIGSTSDEKDLESKIEAQNAIFYI